MFKFGMVKLVIFIIDGTIYWVQLFEVSVFERKEFFYLEI